MLQRHPVVRTLPPPLLYRQDVIRTPVRGRVPQPELAQQAAQHQAFDQPDVTSALAAGDPDIAQAMHEAMLTSSLAYFCEQMLTGPKEYGGKFLINTAHQEWDAMLAASDRVLIEASRDHGKSQMMNIGQTIWRAGWVHPGEEGAMFAATDQLAEEFLEKTRNEVQSNPKLAHLIPPSGNLGNKHELRLRNGSLVRAKGMRSKARGLHPRWIIGDDMLSDEDLYSATIRRKNIDYFLSAITNMVVPGGVLCVVGTPFHERDLYAELRSRGIYLHAKYPALRPDGSPLFPQRYSLELLRRKAQEIGSARFGREFLLRVVTDETSLFPSTLFEGADVRLPYVLGLPARYWHERGCQLYTGMDLAFSSETGADYVVILTLAVDPHGNRYLADMRRGKGWSFQKQLDELKTVNTLMQPELIHIEANQAQRVWTDEVQRTTDLPVRKFFTSGRQPLNPSKRGMTSITLGKHHLERGVPALRLGLEARKWRFPVGDERSLELTELLIGEFGAMTWQDGKVLSVGEHDDIVMACLAPGQWVTTEHGLKEIERVVVGNRVLTHTGQWQRVTKTMTREYRGPMSIIQPCGLSEPLRLTPEHPVWSSKTRHRWADRTNRIEPSLWQWMPASSLRAGRKADGMYVFAPAIAEDGGCHPIDLARYVTDRKPPGFATWHVDEAEIWWRRDKRCRRWFYLTEDSGLFVGLWLAEGSIGCNGASVQFGLHVRETYIVDFLRAFVGDQFGTTVSSWSDGQSLGQSAFFTSVIAHSMLSAMGTQCVREMPWPWLKANQDFLSGVIRGWLIGDGNRSQQHLRGVSCSRRLIEQMRLIASRLGVRACVRPFNANRQPAWSLQLEPTGTTALLESPHAMERERWGVFDRPWRQPNARSLPVERGTAHRLASVAEQFYQGNVYNLEVENDHSYVVGGVAVHNCWLADAAARSGGFSFSFGDADAAPAVQLLPTPAEPKTEAALPAAAALPAQRPPPPAQPPAETPLAPAPSDPYGGPHEPNLDMGLPPGMGIPSATDLLRWW